MSSYTKVYQKLKNRDKSIYQAIYKDLEYRAPAYATAGDNKVLNIAKSYVEDGLLTVEGREDPELEIVYQYFSRLGGNFKRLATGVAVLILGDLHKDKKIRIRSGKIIG